MIKELERKSSISFTAATSCNRSDQFRSGQYGSSSSRHDKPTSPIKKLFNLFACIGQRRERTATNKDTDSLKRIQEHLHIEPAHSPIAPDEDEEEIESFEDGMKGFQDMGFYDQFFTPHGPRAPGYFGGVSSDHFCL
jgi:hypothetical protein